MVWAMAMEAMDWVTGAMAMVLAMEGATMVATVATMASVMLMLSLLLMLSPRLMLTPTTMEAMVWDTEAMAMVAMDLAMEGATMVATMATMASLMLMLSLLLLLSPRLMLTPTTMEDMVWDTGAMVAMDWATEAMAMVLAMEGATMVATVATMASVMLMPSLRLMLTPTTMEDMVWDTEAM